MSSVVRNPLKSALRKQIKAVLLTQSPESRKEQSHTVTKKILDSDAFKQSTRISVYLSLGHEVNTQDILAEMFRQQKEVFVPSYSGNSMVMLKIKDMNDFESLPLTKWNIPQPNDDGTRENAVETGGLDLILLPGVAFTRQGGRLGHGMGYYDKFLHEHFNKNPHRRTDSPQSIAEKIAAKRSILLGLAFNEQIVDNVPLEQTDVLLDEIVTA
ncbi:5-formyltetrahydrofolate cyclo-ligase [Sitodiplosis mosellana]|uniref:5-formyltetrahydrofolate cyclo-ligase n=1 Tax=Sitodiplosis mosellana TaxID=263140 RepID=UPI002444A5D3|nr:5-formyltetrahydrofolate cyclo-ligase [Sitodiplosis mosellana]XP_055320218.1 5-formyltetrahydrofolate cyclo-ligase [Sitodiplosis mosellana]XP_055320219.1 5-formyltetrahydrofolate cyclo-ligase [Sitodiplosis mosellana]